MSQRRCAGWISSTPGRNAIASDTANLLWYLLGLGGWLVPVYQPDVYQRTLGNPVPPTARPVVGLVRVTARRVEISYTWQAGAGRRAALATLPHRVNSDLGSTLAPGGDVAGRLRPFLAVRILGVISLAQMNASHALVCLAKLAGLTRPAWDLPASCATTPAACPCISVVNS